MITSQLKPARWRRGRVFWTRQRTIAVFSYRYDAHLVPALLANLDPIVDGWIGFDDRQAEGIFSSEIQRRQLLLKAAYDARADWILAIDPDERLEHGAAGQIGRLISRRGRVAWGFHLREMYSPKDYRIDGVWGSKMQHRLFRAYDPSRYHSKDLHGPWYPPDLGFREKNSGLNLYHLKMIEPRRRSGRRALYQHLDPKNAMQDTGYDYLADETGARFETIAPGRDYHPPHIDDGGIWMASPGANGKNWLPDV
ncbi:hypothetical protein ACWGTO_09490 [Mesorhizobium sp. PL10]